MYTGVHSDVSQESYSFELFDLSLDVPLVREINKGYVAYVSLWIPLIWGVKVLHSYMITIIISAYRHIAIDIIVL